MNATATHKIIVGSFAFFRNVEGFKPKDVDELYILDCALFGYKVNRMRKNGVDKFILYNSGKDKLIETIEDPLQVGKFLVPEFAKYIDLTIEDLKKLEQWFDKLDNKHSYEKLIYEYYIENNDFFLSEEQLKKVYIKYKEYR